VLISNGLFTLAQLQQLQAVMPTVAAAPANQVTNGWMRDLDLSFNWTYKVKERVELQPGVSFFNVPNFSNYDTPKNALSGILNGQPGSANGTAGVQPDSLRVGLGSGVFGLGAPRVLEFSLKITF